MALLTSTPVTVSVTSFPYSLPNSAGQVVLHRQFHTTSSMRPSSHSAFDWHYACSTTTVAARLSRVTRKAARGGGWVRRARRTGQRGRLHL